MKEHSEEVLEVVQVKKKILVMLISILAIILAGICTGCRGKEAGAGDDAQPINEQEQKKGRYFFEKGNGSVVSERGATARSRAACG